MPNLYVDFKKRFLMLVTEFATPSEFAQAAGLSRPDVWAWRTKDRLPTMPYLYEICRRRKVSADWLMGLTNHPGRTIQPVKQKVFVKELNRWEYPENVEEGLTYVLDNRFSRE